MDGENWIITYEDKGAKKTILVASVPELQDLKNYLKSQGLKSISSAELGIANEKKQTDDKKSENPPLLIVFSVMGILLIIVATLIIRRRKRKRQLRRGEQIK
ncbi:Conserved protein of unknown function (LPXTG_anchor: LPXTG-motif cell wall anchor domain) [endosymbiont DhMRE of Dentiscutata heterogama]|uniref:LPXTG cell wall anchor domain-containing protein n=1 Tax=endosymbiont DhMRE of Dentiscutata heterogama TaxID=1609546 RepID=UPI000629D246|nr:LPXTG cell wall anchor domain-containing protein [endosymbiont DhMRE of Dentiscutata heterogama]CFW92788.1 Conserved protein of unknown function (LPXTG_anchor: LPXTG-motif cell wall anchor domain) [endosymbiont DhMRE of Dentiscutata heterogama]